MSIATDKDLELSLARPLTDSEKTYAGPLLDRAERMISRRIVDFDEQILDEDFSAVVADVESDIVARVLRAPEGGAVMSRESEGDYSYSLNLRVASGLLDVLDVEWDRLGVSSLQSIAPETDGYARARYGAGVRPDLQFQYGWPAQDDLSTEVDAPWV